MRSLLHSIRGSGALGALSVIVAATVVASVVAPAASQSASGGNGVVAFVNVNVVPMDREGVLAGQTVIVRHGRIFEMGPTGGVIVPRDAMRIDGAGKYLMPGLAEMHGHMPSGDFADETMFLYLANGVTTVRGMLGQSGHLELRGQTATGDVLGPTLYLAGPSFSGGSIDSPAQAEQRVRRQKEEGWDLLKIHPGLSLAEYDAMARTAWEVGMRFSGHVPADVGIVHAIKMGQETFDHLDGYLEQIDATDGPIDETRLAELVQMTKDAGAAVVPTMVLWEHVVGLGDVEAQRHWPEMRYWPEQPRQGVPAIQNWVQRQTNLRNSANWSEAAARQLAANRKQLLQALNDGGVRILMGTDSPQIFSIPGFSIHREMQAMVEAGMTPYEVLQSGTKNVGEYFQRQDAFGTVAVGKRADLILVNGNPLEDVGHVADRAGVMVRGRWLTESEIQQRLEAIAGGLTS